MNVQENAHARPNTFLGVSLGAQNPGDVQPLNFGVLIKAGAIRVDIRDILAGGIIRAIIVSGSRADDMVLLTKIVRNNALLRVAKSRILGQCAMLV